MKKMIKIKKIRVGYLDSGKEELKDSHQTFCFQGLGQITVFSQNLVRSPNLFTLSWFLWGK